MSSPISSGGSRRSTFPNFEAARNGQAYLTTRENHKLLPVNSDDEYMESPQPPLLTISRPALSWTQWMERYPLEDPEPQDIPALILDILRTLFGKFSCLTYLTSLLPIITWLPRYKWRTDLVNDLVAGFTVAVMHIPQGMAYGLLAGVPPVVGIYTGFFPVLLYVLLGTMPHVSMGTFAVMSILVSKPVHNLGHANVTFTPVASAVTSSAAVDPSAQALQYSPLNVLSAVCLVVGFLQVCMGLVRIGTFVSILLTDTLISAFTVGASLHVLTSQLKHVLGVKLVQHVGAGRLILTYISLAEQLGSANYVTALLSLACFIFLLVMDKVISVRVKKWCRFPLPTQLVLVVVTTAMTGPLRLSINHGVRIISDIGAIPPGLPPPTLPPLQLIPQVFVDSIPPAIIGYVIGQGLGTMFGSKHGYKVDANQELVAQGASNLLGSFFQCLPMAGSLSRSVVQEASGCRSMLTSLVSCSFLLLVLLWLGPLFSPLPVCVLSTVILASLTGIVAKVADVKRFAERSGWDGAVWVITFGATVLLDVDLGLFVGVAASLAAVLLRGCVPSVVQLGEDPRQEVWVEAARHATLPANATVLAVAGPLHFLTAGYLQYSISSTLDKPGWVHKVAAADEENPMYKTGLEVNARHLLVVIDLSGVTFVDNVGAKALLKVEALVKSIGGTMALAGPSRKVMEVLERNDVVDLLRMEVYPTYLDALTLMQHATSLKTL